MIQLNNVTKFYQTSKGPQYILKNLSFTIPENYNVAVLGSNGAGKSTLFRLIAGSEYVNSGKIITNKSISWPVALATGIHAQMTGAENIRFIGKVNGVSDLELYEQRVKDFSGLNDKLYLPVKNYSSGMRAKLAFSSCIAIDFDIYLIDEATSVADPKFKKKARNALLQKSKSANVIMISHDLDEIRKFCDSAIVMNKGELHFYTDLEEAIMVYERL